MLKRFKNCINIVLVYRVLYLCNQVIVLQGFFNHLFCLILMLYLNAHNECQSVSGKNLTNPNFLFRQKTKNLFRMGYGSKAKLKVQNVGNNCP